MKTPTEKEMWYIHNAMENLEMYSNEKYNQDLNREIFPIWCELKKIWNRLYDETYLSEQNK